MNNEIICGACPYCGQFIEFEAPAFDENEARAFAVARCKCPGAKAENEINQKIKLASERIKALFGENAEENGFEPISSNEAISLLNMAAALVAQGVVCSSTINLSGKCSARVTLGNKGNIVIARRETRASTLST